MFTCFPLPSVELKLWHGNGSGTSGLVESVLRGDMWRLESAGIYFYIKRSIHVIHLDELWDVK